MAGKTKCGTTQKGSWRRMEFIKESRGEVTKETLNIRLNTREVKPNHKRREMDTKCPICKVKKDTT